MSYNEAYSMFETCHTKDADFNAQKLAKLWEAITQDTEVRNGAHLISGTCRLPRVCHMSGLAGSTG
jgi:hypothetical protein